VNPLPLAFAPLGEPSAHRFRQALGLDAETRFEEAFGDRECVIKLGLAREVPHAKIVQPVERTRTALGTYNDLDAQLLSVHKVSITRACRNEGPRRTKFLAAVESAN
jgi:hypothetical protein